MEMGMEIPTSCPWFFYWGTKKTAGRTRRLVFQRSELLLHFATENHGQGTEAKEAHRGRLRNRRGLNGAIQDDVVHTQVSARTGAVPSFNADDRRRRDCDRGRIGIGNNGAKGAGECILRNARNAPANASGA